MSLGFLTPPPVAERRPIDEQREMYPKLRFQVFMGIFIGYAGFYFVRNNLPFVAKTFKDLGAMDETAIGAVGTCILVAYGFSKFLMATLSDRANARYFMPLGLALSAIVNLIIAFTPGILNYVGLLCVLMFINGWFQGMGWPPSGRVLVHWFSTNERGIKTSIWNCAHNVGGICLGYLTSYGIQWFATSNDDWRPAFYTPAIAALVVALIAFLLIRDRPEAMGLPPIEEWRGDIAKVEKVDDKIAGLNTWQILWRYVLKSRVIVMLAIANIFIYTLRYGVLYWVPLYIQETQHADTKAGAMGFVLYEFAGIFGTLLCGWISDKVFKGYRTGAGLVFLVAVAVCIVLFWQFGPTAPLWVVYLLIALIGGLIYGPVMLVGLQAIDLSPREVAGQSAGLTGLAGYLLGATGASLLVGWIIQHVGWDAAWGFLACVAVLTCVVMALVGRDEKAIIASHKARAAAE